jgi:hypothetical protein
MEAIHMRRYAILALALGTFGWQPTNSIADDSTNSVRLATNEWRLYTDAQVQKLAPYDIEAVPGGTGLLDHPALEVVPNGQTAPLAEVLRKLGIEKSRLRDPRATPFLAVVFLRWQISSSYDLCCMTAWDGPSNSGVYGIRIVKRGTDVCSQRRGRVGSGFTGWLQPPQSSRSKR